MKKEILKHIRYIFEHWNAPNIGNSLEKIQKEFSLETIPILLSIKRHVLVMIHEEGLFDREFSENSRIKISHFIFELIHREVYKQSRMRQKIRRVFPVRVWMRPLKVFYLDFVYGDVLQDIPLSRNLTFYDIPVKENPSFQERFLSRQKDVMSYLKKNGQTLVALILGLIVAVTLKSCFFQGFVPVATEAVGF